MNLDPLVALLAVELERPRPLSGQVIQHLSGTYGLERDALGPFLDVELATLEDYQVDLLLSPLFTPQLSDQAVFAGLLGAGSVPRESWAGLVQRLRARPTRAQLVTEDGSAHAVELREVVLERFVHRLRLGGTIPEPLFRLISQRLPAADQPLLMAVARRAIWEKAARCEILVRTLTAALEGGESGAGEESPLAHDVIELLKLTETYEPEDLADLVRRIPAWIQTLRHEVGGATSPKPFFNERVEEMHGGGRDQRRQDNPRLESRQRELAFLGRLKQLLAPEAAPTHTAS